MSRNHRGNKVNRNQAQRRQPKMTSQEQLVKLTESLTLRHDKMLDELLTINLDALHKECRVEGEVADVFDDATKIIYDLDDDEALAVMNELKSCIGNNLITIYRKMNKRLTNPQSVDLYRCYTRIFENIRNEFVDTPSCDIDIIAQPCAVIVCIASAINYGLQLLNRDVDEHPRVVIAASNSIKDEVTTSEDTDKSNTEHGDVVLVKDEIWEAKKLRERIRLDMINDVYENIDNNCTSNLNRLIRMAASTMQIDEDDIAEYTIEEVCEVVSKKIDLLLDGCKDLTKITDKTPKQYQDMCDSIIVETLIDMASNTLGIAKGGLIYKKIVQDLYNAYNTQPRTPKSESSKGSSTTSIIVIDDKPKKVKPGPDATVEEKASYYGMSVKEYEAHVKMVSQVRYRPGLGLYA